MVLSAAAISGRRFYGTRDGYRPERRLAAGRGRQADASEQGARRDAVRRGACGGRPRRAAGAGAARCPRRSRRAPSRRPCAAWTAPAGRSGPVFCMTIAALTFQCARFSSGLGRVVVDAADDRQDAPRAVLQLLGARLHVHHQVAVRLADRAPSPPVVSMFSTILVAVPGLEPRRAGDDLRADGRRDREVDERLQLGAGEAGDEDDLRAGLRARGSGRRARTASCRSPTRRRRRPSSSGAAGRSSATLPRSCPRRLPRAWKKARVAAGHDRLHEGRVGAEGRRHLGGLEDAQPAARAGADEDQAAALAERLADDLDAERDALLLPGDRRDDLAVLVEHQVDDGGRESLSMPRLAGLIASVGSCCHFDCRGMMAPVADGSGNTSPGAGRVSNYGSCILSSVFCILSSVPAAPPAIDAYLDHLRVERRLAALTVESYSRDLAALARFAEASGGAVERLSRAGPRGVRPRADVGGAVAALRGAGRRLRPGLLPLPGARSPARRTARPTTCARRAPGRRCRGS